MKSSANTYYAAGSAAESRVQPPFSFFRVALLYGMGFVGFHILLTLVFLSGLMGVSRTFTTPFRLAFLLGSSLIFLTGVINRKIESRHFVLVFVFGFWLLYLARIIYAYIAETSLGTPVLDYFLKTYGIIVIPSLAFLIPLSERENRGARAILLLSVFAAAFCLLGGYWDYMEIYSYRSIQYQGVDTYYLISPHTLSEIGALLTLLCLYFLLVPREKQKIIFPLSIVGVFLGFFLMLWGASRYAFLSLVCVLPILLFYSRYKIKPIVAIFMTLGACCFIALALYGAAHFAGNKLLMRFLLLYDQVQAGELAAGSGRLAMWSSGWHQFLDNPLFGSGLEEKTNRYLVHQRYLEGFMSTGFLGGTMLLISTVYGVRVALRVLKVCPQFGWLSLLYMYRFFAGWAGQHIFDPIFWYSFMALMAIYLANDVSNKVKQRSSTGVAADYA